MASTGVPPTGRSSAFANRFSGFHRANTLIGGSSLTGVSVATGMRRSRTRIVPCFRAARTHAPVRRCSSLIEISFMCHIVTHRWSHRQGMAHRSRNVLSQRLGRSRARQSFPGAVASGRRDDVANGIDRSKNTRGGRRHPHPNFSDIERRNGESWLGRVMSCSRGRARKPAVAQSQSRHTLLHTRTLLIASCSLSQQTLRLLEFRARDAGPKDRRPAATKSRPMELPISHILTKCGEVAERLKAAVC